MNDMNKKISFNKKISRREALSTAGKIAISAGSRRVLSPASVDISQAQRQLQQKPLQKQRP
jgi:hypothetical protein